jgi:hypothetical protein
MATSYPSILSQRPLKSILGDKKLSIGSLSFCIGVIRGKIERLEGTATDVGFSPNYDPTTNTLHLLKLVLKIVKPLTSMTYSSVEKMTRKAKRDNMFHDCNDLTLYIIRKGKHV